MGNQFCLTAYGENAILVDLTARRIVHWIKPATVEVYFFIVNGGHSGNEARQLFLIDNPSLLLYVDRTRWEVDGTENLNDVQKVYQSFFFRRGRRKPLSDEEYIKRVWGAL